MSEEFNLSEKIWFPESEISDGVFDKEDVKEFIRRLKKSRYCILGMEFNIDKLAGSKLI